MLWSARLKRITVNRATYTNQKAKKQNKKNPTNSAIEKNDFI